MPGRTRIVILLDSLKRGGVQQGVLMQAAGLDAEKYDVQVWALRSGNRDSELADAFAQKGIETRDLPVRHYADRPGIVALAHALERDRIGLINTRSLLPNIVGRIAARLARTPVRIATYHSTYDHRWNDKRLLYEKLLRTGTDAFVCVSNAARDRLAPLLDLPEEKTQVVFNGLDIEAFRLGRSKEASRETLGLPPRIPLIAMVGRLTRVKDIPVFIRAVPEIKSAFPDALFLLVGDGEDRGDLEKLAAQSPHGDSVRFLGSRSDVPEILNAVDCVAMPSLTEGFPRVLLECFAAGTPFVATPAGGVLDILVDGENALLVPFSDPEALARAVVRTLSSPEETARRTARAKEDVRRFGLDNWVRETEAVLDKAIDRSRESVAAYQENRPATSPALLNARYLRFRFAFRWARTFGRTKRQEADE